MKKLLLLIGFVTILSCSKSDDDSNNSSSNSGYLPPAWIQGTWGIKASQYSNEQAMFKFQTDNLCLLTSGISAMCWKETANQYYTMKATDIVVEDTKTASTYEAKLGAVGQTTTLKFEKISATQIKWINGGTNAILDKLN